MSAVDSFRKEYIRKSCCNYVDRWITVIVSTF